VREGVSEGGEGARERARVALIMYVCAGVFVYLPLITRTHACTHTHERTNTHHRRNGCNGGQGVGCGA
jgi:hypothetical protein